MKYMKCTISSKRRFGKVNQKKKNYLYLDWSIDNLDERIKFLESTGVIDMLERNRKSGFAYYQSKQASTYLFRSKDVTSGRKHPEHPYYRDDSSYNKSRNMDLQLIEEITSEEDDVFHDNDEGTLQNDIPDDLSEEELMEIKEMEVVSEYRGDWFDTIESLDEDESQNEEFVEMVRDYVEHIDTLFDYSSLNKKEIKNIILNYNKLVEYKCNELIMSHVDKIMLEIEECATIEGDLEVIECMKDGMLENDIAKHMNVSRQVVNRRANRVINKFMKRM